MMQVVSVHVHAPLLGHSGYALSTEIWDNRVFKNRSRILEPPLPSPIVPEGEQTYGGRAGELAAANHPDRKCDACASTVSKSSNLLGGLAIPENTCPTRETKRIGRTW